MGYDFSRMSCLLVEDNKFMQGVLRIVMDSLGVRNYYFAQDGKEAIEILQLRSGTLKAVGSGGIDVVISDVVMPGIDGSMLLRWIRRSENSPDRFVPVVMISGMVDRKCLTTARDAGVNEFVAKPFSPDIIFKRIQKIIESPRQFVYTPTYFGPDRRRSRGFVEEDVQAERIGLRNRIFRQGPRQIPKGQTAGVAVSDAESVEGKAFRGRF